MYVNTVRASHLAKVSQRQSVGIKYVRAKKFREKTPVKFSVQNIVIKNVFLPREDTKVKFDYFGRKEIRSIKIPLVFI